MTKPNLKDFLACGAFLQAGPDLFKLIVGPFGRHDFSEIPQLKSNTLLYRPHFWDFLHKSSTFAERTLISGKSVYLFNREEFIEFLQQEKSVKPRIDWQPANDTLFRTQFDWSQKLFENKVLEKTVPIAMQEGELKFSYQNLLWCLSCLLNQKSFGWSYGFFENQTAILGHSPEILVNWNRLDRQLHSVALAGTLANHGDAASAILEDSKILNEHQIVIDDICQKLSELSFKSKSIQGPTDVLELKHLVHLMTEFQLEANDLHQVFEVIHKLHPTAAMGIYPNDRSKLTELSEFRLQKQRGGFGAPLVFFDEDSVCSIVAIRNAIFTSDRISIFSGCGITRDSHYEVELSEIKNKRDSVKKMMGLVDE